MDLERAVLKAIRVYRDQPEVWKRLMLRGMKKDYSWARSAREYLALYERAISERLATIE